MTQVFGVANLKGGVGKSSLIHLFALTSGNDPINKKVLVIDASENKQLTYLNAFSNQDKYTIVKSQLNAVPNILAAEAENFDLIFIDFSQNIESSDFQKALLCCSGIIIPTGAGIMDQMATKSFLEIADEIIKLRKAAGYSTLRKVLVSNVSHEQDAFELIEILSKQGVDHFEFPLLRHASLGYSIEKSMPVMDYVTEGIDWTEEQNIFHKVFIEFHGITE